MAPLLFPILLLLSTIKVQAQADQETAAYLRLVRSIYIDAQGISSPAGLAFSPEADLFFILGASQTSLPASDVSDIFLMTPLEQPAGSVRIPTAISDPVNMAFDGRENRLYLFEARTAELIEIRMGTDGLPDPATINRFDAGTFGLQGPRGMTVNPSNGHLFILDGELMWIVRIEPALDQGGDGEEALRDGWVTQVGLDHVGPAELRGMAFNPSNGHLYLLSPTEQRLYELTDAGQVVASRDLSSLDLIDPQAMVFAPSGDRTDDPSRMSLYVADRGSNGKGSPKKNVQGQGRILELALSSPAPVQSPGLERTVQALEIAQASLVQTIDTSQFSPPSPDPSDIIYLPSSGTLLISDSEVNEMPIFTGDNLFETTLAGNLVDTLTTTSFSMEPTGVALNLNDGHLFFSDDNAREIFELDPGDDGIYNSSDDIITSFSTRPFGSNDPEDVSFDSQHETLYLADGVNNEAYQIHPGVNGIFDGVSPAGDDLVTQFDTAGIGVVNPEGIVFNPINGHLYLVGTGDDNSMFEVTTGGSLVQRIDISSANARTLSGLALAPGSTDPSVMNIYIADRGVDNDSDPEENDGRVYEMSLGATAPTEVVTEVRVAAGSDDAEEGASGSTYLTSTDLELTYDGGNQTVGMRFNGVDIPQGATIVDAYVQFQVDETSSAETHLTIRGEDVDHAATFTSAAENISSRPRTTAAVSWSPVPWNTVGEAGPDQRTPDIASVVQEIVNRPGWSDGNSLALIATGTGERVAEAYDGDPAGAPLLHVEYTTGATPGPTVLVGAGDIASCDSDEDDETARLLDSIPGTVFTLGDNVYPDGTESEFSECFDPTWGRHRSRTRPAAGNHDYHVPGAAAYFNYFGASAGEIDMGYYSYELGEWHIIVLNSECEEVGGCDSDSPQGQWLQADLAANPNVCTLAYWHRPLFSSGRYGESTAHEFWQLLYDAGADVVLNGHDHIYERFAPQDPDGGADPENGIRQFIVGTGGGSLYSFETIEPNSEVRNNDTHGVLKVTLHPESYEWEFIPIDGGTFTDFGSGSCSGILMENQTPSVAAGPDQTITLPDVVFLDATVSDDGLPIPPGSVTAIWSQVSGPGAVTFADANAVDTTAGFSEPGTYVLGLTADDGQFAASDEVTIVVTAAVEEIITEVRVAAGSDDAEERPSGSMYLTSTDLELVNDGGDQTVGMRFNGVDIPQGATIVDAYVQFQVDETSSTGTILTIQGEDADHAATFTTAAGDISSRPRTGATVSWSPVAWTARGEAGPDQRTPDIASVVQEIVNRPGWASGNSLAIIVTGTGERVVESYNGDPAGAPLLHVEYGTGGNQVPSVSAGPDQTVTLPEGASLDGTVSDDGLPDPPGTLVTTWGQEGGPGLVIFADANAVDTTVTFSEPGTYVLRLTADDGVFAASGEVTIFVYAAVEEIVTEVRVAAGSDDAEEKPSGSISLTSSDLEMVFDNGDQTVGMRFNGVDIPQGATIVEAYVQFQVDETSSTGTVLAIQGEDVDHAGTFTTEARNISSRPRTSASVSWSPAAWTTRGETGPDQQTPDISSVVQEIVNRPGWASGNSLAILVTGTGERVAESYNGDSAGAPLLHVVHE